MVSNQPRISEKTGSAVANEYRSSRDVIIRTADLSKAAEFYRSVLGLPIIEHGDALIGIETGSFCLYVERGEQHGPVFEFLVADVPGAKRRLLEAGGVVVEEDPALPRCYIRDPFGIVFNLGQAPAGN
jgi:catechol 2,3-dioxygenase-like lactoylglutathione lyase family enzyme